MYPTLQRSSSSRRGESGVALIAALIIMVLISAMLIGFMAIVNSDTRAMVQNRDQTTAYAAAHGGLEQLTASLGQLFATNYRPTNAQVNALVATPPTFPAALGISFVSPGGGSGYTISYQDTTPADGFPDTEVNPRNITEGPYQGLKGVATPFTIEVTARTANGGEARMRREMFTMLIPAFQFGVFSDNDLSFFAGPNFDFGGAVHTNSNLFLAEGNSNTLWLRDRVTAVGEVVRKNLSNGWMTSSNYTGTVRIARYSGDTTGDTLLDTEGSLRGNGPHLPPLPVAGVTPAPGENNSPAWTTTSVTKFRGNLKNARTGARPLVLPLVQMGAQPIDLIRRPQVNSNENVANPSVFGQRYFARASLRILLSDNAADIANLPGVTGNAPIDLTTLLSGGGAGAAAWYVNAANAPIAAAPPLPQAWYSQATGKQERVFPAGTAVNNAAYWPGNMGGITANAYDHYNWATQKYETAAGVNIPDQSFYSPIAGQWQWSNPVVGNPPQPLITGFIKIELQRTNGTWMDVTQEILGLGFTGRRLSARHPTGAFVQNGGRPTVAEQQTAYVYNDYVFGNAPDNGVAPPCNDISPNAIIRLQRVRDDHNPLRYCGTTAAAFPQAATPSQNRWDYIPNALFDPREGNLRDQNALATATVSLGGVMYYVELDARNVARWFAGQIGASGNLAEFSDGGYLVYFSDRRQNARPVAGPLNGLETGELDAEDNVNPADQANGAPNAVLDAGEDVNGIDQDGDGRLLDTIGQNPTTAFVGGLRTGVLATLNATTLRTAQASRVARSNPPIFFRRALKVVNGAGTLADPTVSPLTVMAAGRGLTIASENPVYVQGNYNTGTAGTFGNAQTDHRPSAIIADAVTLLSNNWNDLRSFTYTGTGCTAGPYAASCFGSEDPARRSGTDTSYRMAIVAGKGISFPWPNWGGAAPQDLGTDGGAHNFLRYMEGWAGTINYRGSIISFFTSRQATGIYKCCTNVYSPPTRGYKFDTEFLTLSLLPPKSPAFRDVNTKSFRQVLRPTQ